MPNWCNNSLTFFGPEDVIKEIAATEISLQKLIPCPQELLDMSSPPPSVEIKDNNIAKYGHADWYSWCIENWGTKWDIGPMDCDNIVTENGMSTLYLDFESAWSPPVEAMRQIYNLYAERGLEISGEYIETGCSFLGKITANKEVGFRDQYEEWTNTKELEDIVAELDHDSGKAELRYLMEEEEEEEEEEEDSESE